MRKILSVLLVFLSLLFIADRSFTFLFDRFIFSKTLTGESGGAVNFLLQKKRNVDFIIMGSSRAKFQINPALLTNVYAANGYNASINAIGGTIYNDIVLNLLTSKGFVPKMLILQTDAYPYYTAEDENMKNESFQLYPFMNESKLLRDYVSENTDYTEKIKLLFHSYWYNGKLLSIVHNYCRRSSATDNDRFEGLEGNIDTTDIYIPRDLTKKHVYSQKKLAALLDIIHTCKANNIRLAIVFPPFYKNMFFVKADHDMIIDLLQKNGIMEIYDFSNVEKIPALQSNDTWKDARHLNTKGALIFSHILNNAMGSVQKYSLGN